MGEWILFLAQLSISIITTYLSSLFIQAGWLIEDIQPEEWKHTSRVLVLTVCIIVLLLH